MKIKKRKTKTRSNSSIKGLLGFRFGFNSLVCAMFDVEGNSMLFVEVWTLSFYSYFTVSLCVCSFGCFWYACWLTRKTILFKLFLMVSHTMLVVFVFPEWALKERNEGREKKRELVSVLNLETGTSTQTQCATSRQQLPSSANDWYQQLFLSLSSQELSQSVNAWRTVDLHA